MRRPTWRWGLPVGLLVAEYVALSFLVDLPTSGTALQLVSAVRLVVPVVLGAGAAGWLLSRRTLQLPAGEGRISLPPRRPWPILAAQVAAFGVTAALALHLFPPDAPSLTTGALAVWLACAAVTVLLAISIAAPPRSLAVSLMTSWHIPLLAIALGLASWWVVGSAERLWGLLSGATLHAAAFLLRRVAADVVVDPAERLIGAGDFNVLLAPVCSGVDGVGLVLLFQSVWISLARSRLFLRRALVLLPIGAVAALAANVVRISVLLLVGAAGFEEVAFGGLHSKLGWVLFIGIALGSVAVAERVEWFQRPAAAPGARDGVPKAAAGYVAPLVAALATALLTSVFTQGAFDAWYGARAAAAVLVLFFVRSSLPRLTLTPSWLPALVGIGVCAIWIAYAGGVDGGALAKSLSQLAPEERVAWIAIRVVASFAVIPIVEELAFRGFLLPWLVSPDFERVPPRRWTWPAVALSSLAFGALHQQWLLGTAAGAAFAALRVWRGSLGDAVLAHALCNLGIAAAVLLGGRWDLWS